MHRVLVKIAAGAWGGCIVGGVLYDNIVLGEALSANKRRVLSDLRVLTPVWGALVSSPKWGPPGPWMKHVHYVYTSTSSDCLFEEKAMWCSALKRHFGNGWPTSLVSSVHLAAAPSSERPCPQRLLDAFQRPPPPTDDHVLVPIPEQPVETTLLRLVPGVRPVVACVRALRLRFALRTLHSYIATQFPESSSCPQVSLALCRDPLVQAWAAEVQEGGMRPDELFTWFNFVGQQR